MDTLVYLIQHSRRVVTTDELLAYLWPKREVEASSLHSVITMLRTALGDAPKSPSYIATVPKRGYRIVAKVLGNEASQEHRNTKSDSTICIRGIADKGSDPTLDRWSSAIVEEVSRTLSSSTKIRLLTAPDGDRCFELVIAARRFNDKLRLSAQLIKSSEVIWSESFDLELDDDQEQEKFGSSIAYRVHSEVVFSDHQAEVLARYQGVNQAAAKMHLKAENHFRLARLGRKSNWELYRKALEDTVALDENFAEVYFDIANYYVLRLDRSNFSEAARHAKTALNKAVKKLPGSSRGLYELARIQMNLELDYQGAEQSFRAALEISPEDKWCYFGLGRIGIRQGDRETCRKMLNIACDLEVVQGEAVFLAATGGYFAQIGETAKDLRLLDKALLIVGGGPQRTWLLGVKAGILAWMTEEFDRENLNAVLDEAVQISGNKYEYSLAALYARGGRVELATEIMSKLPKGPLNHAFLALGYFETDQLTKGFEWLLRGVDERVEFVLDGIRIGPSWDGVRSDPRFAEVLRRLQSLESESLNAIRS
jgi:tetratricopeptide (TPR) repeat protein